MFDKLFANYRAISRHRNSPLLDERLQYLEHCAELGMETRTLKEIAIYLLIVVDFFQLESRQNESISEDEVLEQAERWTNREPRPRNLKDMAGSRRRFVKHAKRWLTFLGRLSPSPNKRPPFESYLNEFHEYLKYENELSAGSIYGRYRAVRDFLGSINKETSKLSDITIIHIDEVLTRKTIEDNYATSTLYGYTSNVKAFIRFAENRGWCAEGLSELIEAPRVYTHSNIPSGPIWEDVQNLLATLDSNNHTDIRDRAFIMLFAIYGFRSSEVAALRLDDFDWNKELIHIYRPKQLKTQTYPLAYSVGESVLRYLKEVRPRSRYRELFLLRRAPFTPMSKSSLYAAVSRHLKFLNIESSHYGPHALRHACATRLLQQDHSIKEIGDYLGHKDLEATRVYAKVDMNQLRQVGDLDMSDIL